MTVHHRRDRAAHSADRVLAADSGLARQAAAADPQAAEVWDQMNAERLTGMTHFAADLHRKCLLRAGMSARTARDILWAYTSVELYELLVIRREWTTRTFRDFMTQALSIALLNED
jgi:hypothetical protein